MHTGQHLLSPTESCTSVHPLQSPSGSSSSIHVPSWQQTLSLAPSAQLYAGFLWQLCVSRCPIQLYALAVQLATWGPDTPTRPRTAPMKASIQDWYAA